MQAIYALKRFIALLLVFSCLVFIAGCSSTDTQFPTFSQPTTAEASETIETLQEASSDELLHLTVALPYSSQTIDYLARLYYAKQTNSLGDNVNGTSVSLDYLSSVDLPFIVDSIQTSDEGASVDNVIQWNNSSNSPDIFLTNDYEGVLQANLASPMQDYLSDNTLISGSNIYTDALFACMNNTDLMGLPHYSTMMLIMGNTDFAASTGRLSFSCTYTELMDYMTQIRSEQDIIGNESTVVFDDAYELIPYLGQTFTGDLTTSYMLYEEFEENSEAASNTASQIIDYVDSIYLNNLSFYDDTDSYDPVYSRTAALWIDSTSNASLWNEYYPSTLYYMQIPSAQEGELSSPYVTIYPICLSQNSDCPSLAASFAAFISYDSDALLLINRLEPKIGYFPFVKNSVVWDIIALESNFGTTASFIELQMSDAIFTPHVMNNERYNSINTYIANCILAYVQENGYIGAGFSLSDCLELEG